MLLLWYQEDLLRPRITDFLRILFLLFLLFNLVYISVHHSFAHPMFFNINAPENNNPDNTLLSYISITIRNVLHDLHYVLGPPLNLSLVLKLSMIESSIESYWVYPIDNDPITLR